MSTVLTLNTSSAKCSVALKHGGQLIERESAALRQSAQRVLPMVSELLNEAGIALGDLDLIAVVAGPGSFTGVRIGIAVAQGLGMSAAVPVVPLSSLALMAMACACEQVLVSEQARDEELYFAAYRRSTERGVALVGREQVAQVSELSALPPEFAAASCCLVGDGWTHQEAILKQLGCTAAPKTCAPEVENRHIVELGLLRFQCGEAVDAAKLRPNYVKEQLDYS